jgi:hypothetical protein
MREGHTPSDQDAVWSKYGIDVVRRLLLRQTIQKISNQAGYTAKAKRRDSGHSPQRLSSVAPALTHQSRPTSSPAPRGLTDPSRLPDPGIDHEIRVSRKSFASMEKRRLVDNAGVCLGAVLVPTPTRQRCSLLRCREFQVSLYNPCAGKD